MVKIEDEEYEFVFLFSEISAPRKVFRARASALYFGED